MDIFVAFLFDLLGLALLLPTITLAAEVFVGLISNERKNAPYSPVRFKAVIPAHDEEQGIAKTLNNLIVNVGSSDPIIVVADNCSDRTAEIARSLGVEVVERMNATERGKGYALAFGMNHIRTSSSEIEVLIFVDADCVVTNGSLSELAAEAYFHMRPMQALYLMVPGDNARSVNRISAFAVRLKNDIRLRGCKKLGIPVPLTGSGIAVPYRLLDKITLASDNLVEDLKLGLDLTMAGNAPTLSVRAQIEAFLPSQHDAQFTQRRRWEHGYMSVMLTYIPILFRAFLSSFRLSLLGGMLDLGVPPLSLHVGLILGYSCVTAAVVAISGDILPFCLGVLNIGILACVLTVAWAKRGRDLLSAKDLLSIPIYMAAKIPIYIGVALGKTVAWTRTQR